MAAIINPRKVAIVGCGFVGSASAFALMQSGLFSEMVLIDVDHDRAEGEALDIAHGMAFGSPMNIYAGDYSDIDDAAITVITAGANQAPGETRLDLVNKNVAIFKSIIPQIAERDYQGILLVVSNPVDILTYVALKLSGMPANRVLGSGTTLDTARFKYALGEHLGVDPRNVHARIIGEHGDSEIAAWSLANISGIPLNDFCELRGHTDHQRNMDRIAEEVKNAAYEIIKKKRATYYGIAMTVNASARPSLEMRSLFSPCPTTSTASTACTTSCCPCPRSSAPAASSTRCPLKSTRRKPSSSRLRPPRCDRSSTSWTCSVPRLPVPLQPHKARAFRSKR